MTFKECLRRIIGGRSYGNRLHLFRRFWSAMLNESSEYKTEADRLNGAGEQIAYFKLNHVSEGEFGDIARNFFKWRKERDRQQRTNAVKSRWQKQKLVRGKKPKK